MRLRHMLTLRAARLKPLVATRWRELSNLFRFESNITLRTAMIQDCVLLGLWRARKDSNLRPLGSKPSTLSN